VYHRNCLHNYFNKEEDRNKSPKLEKKEDNSLRESIVKKVREEEEEKDKNIKKEEGGKSKDKRKYHCPTCGRPLTKTSGVSVKLLQGMKDIHFRWCYLFSFLFFYFVDTALYSLLSTVIGRRMLNRESAEDKKREKDEEFLMKKNEERETRLRKIEKEVEREVKENPGSSLYISSLPVPSLSVLLANKPIKRLPELSLKPIKTLSSNTVDIKKEDDEKLVENEKIIIKEEPPSLSSLSKEASDVSNSSSSAQISLLVQPSTESVLSPSRLPRQSTSSKFMFIVSYIVKYINSSGKKSEISKKDSENKDKENKKDAEFEECEKKNNENKDKNYVNLEVKKEIDGNEKIEKETGENEKIEKETGDGIIGKVKEENIECKNEEPKVGTEKETEDDIIEVKEENIENNEKKEDKPIMEEKIEDSEQSEDVLEVVNLEAEDGIKTRLRKRNTKIENLPIKLENNKKRQTLRRYGKSSFFDGSEFDSEKEESSPNDEEEITESEVEDFDENELELEDLESEEVNDVKKKKKKQQKKEINVKGKKNEGDKSDNDEFPDKIVIFSQWTTCLNVLQNVLEKEKEKIIQMQRLVDLEEENEHAIQTIEKSLNNENNIEKESVEKEGYYKKKYCNYFIDNGYDMADFDLFVQRKPGEKNSSSTMRHFMRINPNTFNYVRFDGTQSTNEQKKMLDKFEKNNNYKILLASLKAGGVGLNLIKANHVILIDKWWKFFFCVCIICYI
jgi:hypothetical protein